MVWPIWISAALVVAVYATWRRADARPALLILVGLILARMISGLPFELRMMAGGLIWCGIGSYLIRRAIAPVPGGLLIAAGLCYLAARLAYSPVSVGSAPFFASDVFGVLALGSTAWGAHSGGNRVAHRRGGLLGGAVAGRGDCADRAAHVVPGGEGR